MSLRVLVSIGCGIGFSKFAHLLVLDLDSKKVIEIFKYRHRLYPQSTKGFLGISRKKNGNVLVNTEAEIMEFALNPIVMANYFTWPFFNDIHFAMYDEITDQIFVCNTGLDSLEIFDCNFKHLRSIPLAKGMKYLRQHSKAFFGKIKRTARNLCLKVRRQITPDNFFAEDIRYKNLSSSFCFANIRKAFFPQSLYKMQHDFRYVLFRPHILHPNYLCRVANELLLTIKNIGSIISLSTGLPILTNLEDPHDGILAGDTYLITESSRGTLLFARKVKTVDDINEQTMETINICEPSKGFVRGVDLLDDNTAVVSISKRREINDKRPAWLAIVDLNDKKIIDRFEVPIKYGTNPFSVINVSNIYL